MKSKAADSSYSKKSASPWYRNSRRRILVDMHIPDWDDEFLSKLDVDKYLKTVVKGNCDSFMLYCNSHVGLAHYPSKIGAVHRAFKKQDFTGEVLEKAHKRGLSVVAYYSAVFNNASFLEHPEWRIIPLQGESVYETSRYGACCPNSTYRNFAIAQTEEICRTYPFDGIFFDMLFWPYICYCPHCRNRFYREEKQNLPVVINWNDPSWMAFQRARERWMSELAGDLTAAVRRARPGMSVTHQMSPVLLDWRLAMPYSITEHCDYASGDFYGPPTQQSVVCKIYEAISRNRPFEFMTSRCVDLRDHATTKSASRMEAQAFLAPAHAASFMFIDGINPTGTLNSAVYDRIGEIFSKLKPYEKFLGGKLEAEVAIYVSSESRFDFNENGIDVGASSNRSDNMATEFAGQHMAAVMGAARGLQEAHIPYGVVTKQNLARMSQYRTLILPNVLVMSDEEIEAVRAFVAAGGTLYASGYSSLVAANGKVRPDFGLADVFGVSARGGMRKDLSFYTPIQRGLINTMAPQDQLVHRAGWIPIKNKSAKVLANLTLPWCPEKDCTVMKPSFVSIHSNPPASEPEGPGITLHRYKRGKVCYVSGPVESEKQPVNRLMVANLIRELIGRPLFVEADIPAHIEITVYHKEEEECLNLSLISLRQEEEPIPCAGEVRVRLGDQRSIQSLRLLPGKKKVPFKKIAGGIEFAFQDFEIFSLYELQYKKR